MREGQSEIGTCIGLAWRCWAALTGLFVVFSSVALAVGGWNTLKRCVQTDGLSISAQTLACAGFVWLTVGGALFLSREAGFRSRYGWPVVLAGLLLVLYLNILRERPHYADVQDYVQGAFDLSAGAPFHIRYLYPPLLAVLCQPFLFLGHDGLAAMLWCLNWVGLVLFFILLTKALEAYGVGPRVACVGVFLFMLVNVPVLRTLSFVQVNFHMMNLILLALLLFPRHRLLSALMLALAVHLKASPLLIALPFLCLGDRRWLLSFAVSGCGLAAVIYLLFGPEPFTSFLANAKAIYTANGVSFRENSIDALVRTAAIALRRDGTALVPYIKWPVLVALAGLVVYSMRVRMWSERTDPMGRILNGLPLSLLLMVYASPLVWEHHFVFLAVPFLLVLRKIATAPEWVAFGAAYVSVYWMPTFDFYPWSFCRLAGSAVLLVLALRLTLRGDASWLRAVGQGISCNRNGAPPAKRE